MLGHAGDQWKANTAAFYLWVKDVDEVYSKALAAGASSESAPEDKPYGHRNAGVVDKLRHCMVDRGPSEGRRKVSHRGRKIGRVIGDCVDCHRIRWLLH
jgi:hypothetical protein